MQEFLADTPHDPTFAICDSMPLAACLFARAYRCRRFRGEATFGNDTLLRQTFYGFRVHVRVCWPGVITRISVAPANAHELSLLPELADFTSGIVVGDRNYHSPKTKEELAHRVWASNSWPHTPPRKEIRLPEGVPCLAVSATA
jgi:hypothetical protein